MKRVDWEYVIIAVISLFLFVIFFVGIIGSAIVGY